MRFFIGDVHGCAKELELLIQKIHKVDSKAELIAVGDLINKGPDSLRVLELVKEFHIQCIMGNHEGAFLRIYHTPKDLRTPKDEKMIQQFMGQESKWAPFISTWPYWLEWDDIDCVHAGIQPGKTDFEQMNQRLITTIRTWDGKGECLDSPDDPAWFECVNWPKKIVFGHWAVRGLVNEKNVVGLDTGCVYGKELTAWCAEMDHFFSVKAKKQYVAMIKD